LLSLELGFTMVKTSKQLLKLCFKSPYLALQYQAISTMNEDDKNPAILVTPYVMVLQEM
jgi:hypothetical protein